jgi:hypothetical protein
MTDKEKDSYNIKSLFNKDEYRQEKHLFNEYKRGVSCAISPVLNSVKARRELKA